MQHDTSPHDVVVGKRTRRLQCASLVLCFSRVLFFQVYPRFDRFWAKVFLVDAILYFLGCARDCMVDNTSVLIAHGTGADAVAGADLEMLANHFGFKIVAHEKGDTNRSARVERPFWYIERNFYPGRTFSDLNDVNTQARVWCDRSNNMYRRSLKGSAFELLAAERPALVPLPIHVPEITCTNRRTVDAEGYIHFQTNRYPVPSNLDLIHREVEVLSSKNRVRIFDGHKLVAEHPRREDGLDGRIPSKEPGRHRRAEKKRELPEAPVLRSAAPVLGELVEALECRHGGRAVRHVRALYRMYLDYPTDILREAVTTALAHGLIDLHRIETMILSRLAGGDFFRLPDEDCGPSPPLPAPPLAVPPSTDPVSSCVAPNAPEPPSSDASKGDNDHDDDG
jgi:hypothetical protein